MDIFTVPINPFQSGIQVNVGSGSRMEFVDPLMRFVSRDIVLLGQDLDKSIGESEEGDYIDGFIMFVFVRYLCSKDSLYKIFPFLVIPCDGLSAYDSCRVKYGL